VHAAAPRDPMPDDHRSAGRWGLLPRRTVHLWSFDASAAGGVTAARDARTGEGLCGDAWWVRVLATYLDVHPAALALSRGAYGKPRIEAGAPKARRLRFSRAATRGLELLAVAWDRGLGIDVEWSGPGAMACPRLSITEEAGLRRVAPSNRERARRLAWTVREAWAKAIGDGLAATARLEVAWTTAGQPRCHDPFATSCWSARVVETGPDHVASIVCEGGDPFDVLWMPAQAPGPARDPAARSAGVADRPSRDLLAGGNTCSADTLSWPC